MVVRAAEALRVDTAAARVIRHLEAHGLEVILLKGSALGFLYADDGPRTYADVDLLVDPARHEEAGALLAGLGYRSLAAGLAPHEQVAHATTFLADDGPAVDLHRTLAGIGADPSETWGELRTRTQDHDLVGHSVRILDGAARALHVALHVAQSGPGFEKPSADLDRALRVVDEETWAEAGHLADRLTATPAMAAALRSAPAGRELADRLGLPTRLPLRLDLRQRTTSPLAGLLDRLARTPGTRAKARLVLRSAVPSSAAVRLAVPVAARGGPWVVAGYAIHTGRTIAGLLRGLPPLATAVLRRRR
ncbi:MAG TPA: nucleotidyltransferase family protein [Acidimicrobiales bacterium]|nr:nucleotidyltransferase family protein [Acidimicrobiales bacterium]